MQGGLVARNVSVRLSNAWIVTEQKKNLSRFYTVQRIIYPGFLRKRMAEILGQTDRVGAKSPIFSRFARSASAVTRSEKQFN